MSAKHIVKEGGEVAFALLKLTQASADAFPPLKSAAGGALHIAELVLRFKSNQADWKVFGQYVRDILACVIHFLPDASEPREDLKRNLEKLRDTLEHIRGEIERLQHKTLRRRIWSYTKHPEKILEMRQKLQDSLSLFQLGSMLTTGFNVAEVLKGADIQHHMERVIKKLSGEIGYNLVLNTLPYAAGASWDPACVCLEETRVALLADILNWLNSANAATRAEIFWLTDVAGAGKSALAHTVAQRCFTQGLLASSFFFDREVEGRNNPKLLFSTIARDLANLNGAFAERICLAIENDRSLPTSPISRQFDELILGPSVLSSGGKPVVIVIDALDEGYSTVLLKILRDGIPRLPTNFRIFLTSRSEDQIDFFLSEQSHILRRIINIYGEANQTDIASYVHFRLNDIAERKRLDTSWPGEELASEFTMKADGLFLWASTVSDYLRLANNPVKQLKLLLSEHNHSNVPAEAKMDNLYATIMRNCNWGDEDFAEGYGLVMGALIAVKTPLSLSAIQAMHPQLRVRDILSHLGPLIDGWMEESRPVRIIHLSFRDFVTIRANASPETSHIYVSEMDHSQRLALVCLLTLNQGFEQTIPGIGYLTEHASEIHVIPEVSEEDISEQFWYACRFWIDHIVIVKVPELALINALRSFLSAQLVHWIEVVTSKGRFLKLRGVWEWILETLPEERDFMVAVFNAELAACLSDLSFCLSDLGRREEALQAIEDAVGLYRRLVEEHPTTFDANLAMSLNNFSLRLSNVGQREAALTAIEEAVELYWRLTDDHPIAFCPDLAMSLNNLSTHLSDLGRREESLEAIENAVKLRRHLAAERPTTFNPMLAISLNNLSIRLSDLGRPEDSLQAIEDAVAIYRPLVEDRPSVFNPDLALSLNNLSLRLSELGRREESLQVIEEAVKLHKQLADEHPITFQPDLAMSFNNLSLRLSDLQQREASLQAVEDAVQLYQQLAEDRPAAFNPDLSLSLNNLSICLANVGQREESLRAIEDAVELRRRLAKERPAVFNPDLAMSLNNLSISLSNLGRHEDALRAIEDALTLRRNLAEENPAAFNPDLAMSLYNLSSCLSDLGRQEESLPAIEDAVEVYRSLANDHPAAFNPNLALSLYYLSVRLYDVGRREESVHANEDAVKLYRSLAADQPGTFDAHLAMSLQHLSLQLCGLGKREASLQAIEEAVVLYRGLNGDHPEAFKSRLARSLDDLSLRLSRLGRQTDALQVAEEAIQFHRHLAEENPQVFNPDLAISLQGVSIYLSDLGRYEEALQAIEDAVGIYRLLTKDNSAKFSPDFALSLDNLSIRLYRVGRREEALLAVKEAVGLYRELAESDPITFNSDLAMSLNSLSLRLSDLDRQEESLCAIKEAVELYRRLAEVHPETYDTRLAGSLHGLSLCLSRLDRREEAILATDEAVILDHNHIQGRNSVKA